MENKIIFLGVGINNLTEKQVLEYVLKNLNKKYYVVTLNPEILVLANDNKTYKKVLNNANLALPDGVGIIWAAKLLGLSLKERTTGIGLLDSICQAVAKRPITVGFLGGRDGVAVKTAECLKKSYPSLKVAFASSEFGVRSSESHNYEPITKMPAADILFVALGSPKQELWISKNLHKLPVRVAIGVGGAFDFISGKIPRAPRFVRSIGLEWFFRLVIQPWRIKRQLRLLKFICLVLKQSLRST